MSDTKFTPGPWRVSDVDHEGIADDSYHFIAAGKECHGNGPDGGFEIAGCMSTSDARLIAAAPELFEALREFIRIQDAYANAIYCEDAEEADKAMESLRKSARAAIAKATGEQA